jgi:hypothetical protein
MSDLTVPDCRVYVDADVGETEMLGIMTQLLYAEDRSADGCEADVVRNPDYDSNRRRQFPGGFIYFRYYIDLYMDELPTEKQARLVTTLLEGLWDWGCPAVAACSYEDWLPEHGGYRSTAVPWPA